MGNLVASILRTKVVFDKMNADARPNHKRLELAWPFPDAEKSVFLGKTEPLLLRRVERVHLLARCTVLVDEFPLRHANFDERLRVAWGTGDLLGKPAIVVATAAPGERAKVSVKWLTDGDTAVAR